MTDKIIVTPSMVRLAYDAQKGGVSERITDVTAHYIAKGLTEALNPPKWTVYQAKYTLDWGVEDKANNIHMRLYRNGAADRTPRATSQRIADALNEAHVDV